jgi:hypothetical protein
MGCKKFAIWITLWRHEILKQSCSYQKTAVICSLWLRNIYEVIYWEKKILIAMCHNHGHINLWNFSKEKSSFYYKIEVIFSALHLRIQRRALNYVHMHRICRKKSWLNFHRPLLSSLSFESTTHLYTCFNVKEVECISKHKTREENTNFYLYYEQLRQNLMYT